MYKMEASIQHCYHFQESGSEHARRGLSEGKRVVMVSLENLGRRKKRNFLGHSMLARVLFREMSVAGDKGKKCKGKKRSLKSFRKFFFIL